MRAFILRNDELKKKIKNIVYDKKTKFNQKWWLNHSDESFHGEIKNGFFEFKDVRIPDGFKLKIDQVIIEK